MDSKLTSWRTRSYIRLKRSNKRFLMCDCKFAYTTNPIWLNLWMKFYFTIKERNCLSLSWQNWFFFIKLDNKLFNCCEAQDFLLKILKWNYLWVEWKTLVIWKAVTFFYLLLLWWEYRIFNKHKQWESQRGRCLVYF